jgi:hypothetical protein
MSEETDIRLAGLQRMVRPENPEYHLIGLTSVGLKPPA